jgi:excisionase family DNA binding protein
MMAEQQHESPIFLTVSDVAARLNVSKMTVYRLVHSGEMEAVRFGHTFRVSEEAVEHYLADAVVSRDSAPHPQPH